MDLFTIDFETYYDREYSLSRMSTEDYVSDGRFEIIMVGLKKNSGRTEIFSSPNMEDYRTWLLEKGVHRGAVLAHNMLFDGLILASRLKITPPMVLDTLCMAQALLKPFHKSISLEACLKHENSPFVKGTAVHNMIGRRLASMTSQELGTYGEYCANDVDSTYWLFQKLKSRLPRDELEVIDTSLRMYLEPSFILDPSTLEGLLRETREKKQKLMDAAPDWIKKSALSSNPQFAKLLSQLGVHPIPTKISPTTGKITFAFSKNDPGWKDLEEEYIDDPVVGPILAARLGVKSTIAETRGERFLDIARNHGKLRVPLRYYGAHTGRYGGMEKINCQNLTRVRYRKDGTPDGRNQLRFALRAPKGHVVLSCDLSQIEARINAWLAECRTLLDVFASGGDPYCAFASVIYNRLITKADKAERFAGKTCILGLGYGMGPPKLRSTFRKDNVKVTLDTARRYVYTYRDTYHEIPALWKHCDRAVEEIARGGLMMIGPCMASKDRVSLPNGMAIIYDKLRFVQNAKYNGWVFNYAGRVKMLWGGTMVENIVQALARIALMEQMIKIRKELGIRPKLNIHDELVYIVPEAHIDHYESGVVQIMSTPPAFAPELPIGCEAHYGYTLGDCK